jgi:3-hydroxyisobutyrate dehydrogenase
MEKRKVAVIGLGNMGGGIARSFMRDGRFALMAWDVNEAARAKFDGLGGVTVSPPAEMAATANVILFVVPATPQILDCMNGPDGIFAHARARAGSRLVVYDLTTSDPDQTRRLVKRAAKFGIDYLDAGTSGGPANGEKGKLLTMVGGERAVFERTRDVFEPICAHVFFVGPSGAGHTLKLLHNIICHSTMLATCEAGHMAEKAGISVGDMIEVINVSNARSYASEVRFPNHIVSGTWDLRSRIFNLFKDIKMGVKMGKRLGADTTYSRATLGLLERAMKAGMENDDYSLLYRDFDKVRQTKRK